MTDQEAFRDLVQAIRIWAEGHMNQWERFKYTGPYGTIYVTIAMKDDHPDSFNLVDPTTGEIIQQAGMPAKEAE